MNVKRPIRRFTRADGRWVNIAHVEGKIVEFSGIKGSTVPYYGDVTERSFTLSPGVKAGVEMERFAAGFKQRKYAEVLPSKKPAGEAKIDGLWRRFENWLYKHVPAYCRWPLAPGASERDVLAFEKKIGARLPDDVRRSYRRHNGSAGVPLLAVVGEQVWVPLKRAAEQWKFFRDIRPDLEAAGFLNEPHGPMKKVHGSDGWIPISDNGGGDHLCVDLDPAKGGKVGQLFSHWHEYGAWRIVSPGFSAFLERLLRHLARGRYAINEQGQLAPVDGPAPESVGQVQDYFLRD